MNWTSFADEFEKIAVTMKELQRLAQLAKKRGVKLPGIGTPSAISRQSARQHLAGLRAAGDPNAPMAEKFLRYATGKVVIPRKGDITSQMTSSLGFEGMMPDTYKALAKLKKSPKGRRALEGIIRGHELQELSKAHKGFSGVHAKGVIPVEHNVLATLPREAKPAGEFMKALRREHPGQEALDFAAATRRPGGQTMTFGEGSRLSRHAVKRIGEGMQRSMEKRRDEVLKRL